MLPNPCPCTTLQRGVKAVAAYYIVGNLLNIFNISAILGEVDALDIFLLRGLQKTSHSILIVLLILNMLIRGFGIVLYLGAEHRDATMCWVWLGFRFVYLIFDVIISSLVYSGNYRETPVVNLSFGVFFEIIQIAIFTYSLFVVYAFIIEIRNQQDQQLNPANQVSTMAQPQGSVYGAMEAGTAEQPNYPIESRILNQPQPTSVPAL